MMLSMPLRWRICDRSKPAGPPPMTATRVRCVAVSIVASKLTTDDGRRKGPIDEIGKPSCAASAGIARRVTKPWRDFVDAPLMEQQNSRYNRLGHTFRGGPPNRCRMKRDSVAVRHAGTYPASELSASAAARWAKQRVRPNAGHVADASFSDYMVCRFGVVATRLRAPIPAPTM